MTYTRRFGMRIFSPSAGRWITGREKLNSMLFPVYQEQQSIFERSPHTTQTQPKPNSHQLAHPSLVPTQAPTPAQECAEAADVDLLDLSDIAPRSQHELIGNAMCLGNVALVMLAALTCVEVLAVKCG